MERVPLPEPYVRLLQHSYEVAKTGECPPLSKMDFLGEHIFDFTTYDSDMSEFFASIALEVCAAISERRTFAFIEDQENYRWFLLMCNLPFFADKLSWGTSIRGAWWDTPPHGKIKLNSCGLFRDYEQIADPLEFDVEEWERFVAAMREFVTLHPAYDDKAAMEASR